MCRSTLGAGGTDEEPPESRRGAENVDEQLVMMMPIDAATRTPSITPGVADGKTTLLHPEEGPSSRTATGTRAAPGTAAMKSLEGRQRAIDPAGHADCRAYHRPDDRAKNHSETDRFEASERSQTAAHRHCADARWPSSHSAGGGNDNESSLAR